jgi:protein-tyrosine phosphatase
VTEGEEPRPLHVLAVCIGNVCRSPFTERLLALRAAARGLPVTTSSAGIGAVVGSGIHPHEQEELLARGIDPSGFAARQLTADHLVSADLVLTATREIRTAAVQLHPVALRKTFTLTEAAALAASVPSEPALLHAWVGDAARRRATVGPIDYDVPDPIGRDREAHAEVTSAIERAVDMIVEGWSRGA